jgi:hypothetical protein
VLFQYGKATFLLAERQFTSCTFIPGYLNAARSFAYKIAAWIAIIDDSNHSQGIQVAE